jgi:hypothetical protein
MKGKSDMKQLFVHFLALSAIERKARNIHRNLELLVNDGITQGTSEIVSHIHSAVETLAETLAMEVFNKTAMELGYTKQGGNRKA